ncbi:MAG: hypothetical protein IKT60_02795 [Clostridia bacterium]|nr:hypothetical protein [Clostridia bacterium]
MNEYREQEMGDIFNEKLVARIPTFKILMLKTLIVLAAAGIIVFAFMTLFTIKSAFSYLFAFVVTGAGYGAWYLVKQLNVEFEYAVTNSTLDVDKIIAQARRKSVVSMDIHNIEEAGPADEIGLERVKNYDFAKIVDCTSHVQAPGRWYIIYSDNGAKTLLFIEPNEKMIRSFRTYAPGAVEKR